MQRNSPKLRLSMIIQDNFNAKFLMFHCNNSVPEFLFSSAETSFRDLHVGASRRTGRPSARKEEDRTYGCDSQQAAKHGEGRQGYRRLVFHFLYLRYMYQYTSFFSYINDFLFSNSFLFMAILVCPRAISI